MFDAGRLRALCPQASETIISGAAPVLDERAQSFEITTLLRRAHFIAQLAHESARFTKLTENLDYSAERIAAVWPRLKGRADELAHNPEALGNAAYANRLGNGNELSGDGWRYRGRGLIQITGKGNYFARGNALELDLVSDPDQAEDPETAALIAMSFWQARGCSGQADRDDVEAVTRIINGGTEGLADRRALTERARTIFVEEPEGAEQ